MNAWLNYVGCGLVALSVLACGSKGEDDGGEEETGGTSGSGGSSTGGTSTGGSSTGGSSTGGSGGSGTLPPMTTMSFSEASDVCPNPLPDPNMADCWKFVDSNADTTSEPIPDMDIDYEHTTEDGNPEDGAFQATIPYTMTSQWVSFGINFASQDLSNRTIRARVKVASGLGTANDAMPPGGTKIYAKSGMGYCYANGDYTNLGDAMHPIGEWITVQFNLNGPFGYEDPNCTEPFSASDIREIGIQFDSGSAAMGTETAVVLIDDVQY